MSGFEKGHPQYDAISKLFNICKKYNHVINDNEWTSMKSECRSIALEGGEDSFLWDLMIAFLNDKRRESENGI